MFYKVLSDLIFFFPEGKAPLGFEPEGSCSNNDNGSRSPSHEGTRSPPPYLQWAKNLDFLLQDPEGVELFKTYVIKKFSICQIKNFQLILKYIPLGI